MTLIELISTDFHKKRYFHQKNPRLSVQSVLSTNIVIEILSQMQ